MVSKPTTSLKPKAPAIGKKDKSLPNSIKPVVSFTMPKPTEALKPGDVIEFNELRSSDVTVPSYTDQFQEKTETSYESKPNMRYKIVTYILTGLVAAAIVYLVWLP